MIRDPTDGCQTAEILLGNVFQFPLLRERKRKRVSVSIVMEMETRFWDVSVFHCSEGQSASGLRARVELVGSRKKQNFSCQENEDQRLFRLSLLRELSCNDQGRRSEQTTLPDQLWAHSVGDRILIFLPHPPSLRNMVYGLLLVI
jgi:hypothetical protein